MLMLLLVSLTRIRIEIDRIEFLSSFTCFSSLVHLSLRCVYRINTIRPSVNSLLFES